MRTLVKADVTVYVSRLARTPDFSLEPELWNDSDLEDAVDGMSEETASVSATTTYLFWYGSQYSE